MERDRIGEPAAAIEEFVRDVDFATHAAPLAGADRERTAGGFGGEEEFVEGDLERELRAALGAGHLGVRGGEGASGPAHSQQARQRSGSHRHPEPGCDP